MGRTNWIILGMGAIACVALALVMQHAADVFVQKKRPAAAREVQAVLGRRLDAPPSLRLEERESGVAGLLVLAVPSGIALEPLATDAGHVVWRTGVAERTLLEVVVECRVADRPARRFRVPPPWRPTERVVELRDTARR